MNCPVHEFTGSVHIGFHLKRVKCLFHMSLTCCSSCHVRVSNMLSLWWLLIITRTMKVAAYLSSPTRSLITMDVCWNHGDQRMAFDCPIDGMEERSFGWKWEGHSAILSTPHHLGDEIIMTIIARPIVTPLTIVRRLPFPVHLPPSVLVPYTAHPSPQGPLTCPWCPTSHCRLYIYSSDLSITSSW